MNKVLLEYVNKNKKIFIKLLLFILIGIVIGVIYFNLSLSKLEKDEINIFINNTHGILKQNENIDFLRLLKLSIKKNICLILAIGICGLCIFGNVLNLIILVIIGFTLGFTIASSFSAFGLNLNFFIMMISLIIQNLIFIPSILLLSEKSNKLYKNIITKMVTMKEELCKHIIIMLIIIVFGIIASLIEIYISMNFLIVF